MDEHLTKVTNHKPHPECTCLIGGPESQTSYPRVHIVRQVIPGFNEKTPWIKRGCRALLVEEVIVVAEDKNMGNVRRQRDKRQENAARYTHVAGG